MSSEGNTGAGSEIWSDSRDDLITEQRADNDDDFTDLLKRGGALEQQLSTLFVGSVSAALLLCLLVA